MILNPKRFYWFLIISCIAGYLWLFFSSGHAETLCLMKSITGVPCPSCGSTRSVMAIFRGNLYDAFHWNPLGFLIFLIMMISPFWVGYDIFNKKQTLWASFLYLESKIKKKEIAIPLLLLVAANWIWNIFKHV